MLKGLLWVNNKYIEVISENALKVKSESTVKEILRSNYGS